MEDCMLSKAFELQRAARNVVCIVNHASLQEVQTMQGNKAFKNVNAVTMLFQCCWSVIQMLLWSLVSSAYRNIFSAYLSQGSCCSRALISRSLCSSWGSVRGGKTLIRREAVNNRQARDVLGQGQEQAVRQVQGRGVGVDQGTRAHRMKIAKKL